MTDQYTIAQIKNKLSKIRDLTDPFFLSLLEDQRKGVQQAIQAKRKEVARLAQAEKAFQERLSFEKELWTTKPGCLIAGVDEVGRGPLAGPVVAAAVILPDDLNHWRSVNDSKTLSLDQRTQLSQMIRQEAKAWAIAQISPQEIDQINIYQAAKLAMENAVNQLALTPDYLLVDAMRLDNRMNQKALIKGDQRSLSIAAASIIAKDYRDKLMLDLAEAYPQYGFDQHMGYPTPQHLRALEDFGVTDHHRRSFGPVQKLLEK